MSKFSTPFTKAKRQTDKRKSRVCCNDDCDLPPNCGLHCQRCGGRCTPLAQYSTDPCTCSEAVQYNRHTTQWMKIPWRQGRAPSTRLGRKRRAS